MFSLSKVHYEVITAGARVAKKLRSNYRRCSYYKKITAGARVTKKLRSNYRRCSYYKKITAGASVAKNACRIKNKKLDNIVISAENHHDKLFSEEYLYVENVVLFWEDLFFNKEKSNMKIEERLFSEFKPATYEEWYAEAVKLLKGAPFDKKMYTKTPEGITLKPIYNRADVDFEP